MNTILFIWNIYIYNPYLLDWLELWPQNYKTELRMKKLRVFTHMIHSAGGRRFSGVVVGGWFCWKTLGAIERYEETETARMGTWNSLKFSKTLGITLVVKGSMASEPLPKGGDLKGHDKPRLMGVAPYCGCFTYIVGIIKFNFSIDGRFFTSKCGRPNIFTDMLHLVVFHEVKKSNRPIFFPEVANKNGWQLARPLPRGFESPWNRSLQFPGPVFCWDVSSFRNFYRGELETFCCT